MNRNTRLEKTTWFPPFCAYDKPIILHLIIHSLIGNSITKELQKAYCHWKLLTKKRDTEQTVSLGADYAVGNLKHIDDKEISKTMIDQIEIKK